MLEAALRARIPMIAVETTDPGNAARIISHVLGGRPVYPYVDLLKAQNTAIVKGATYIAMPGQLNHKKAPEHTYEWFQSNEASLVAVNFEPGSLMFDAGLLPTPSALVKALLEELVDGTRVCELLPALGGLTLKEVGWVLRLAMAEHRELSRRAVTYVRKCNFPARRGLVQVDTTQAFYAAPSELRVWLKYESAFFLRPEVDARLIPRGLLFDGPPGTGKTAGAKWISEQMGVPLYRFDAASVKGKYVGETEKGITRALQEIDREAPAIYLIDEVEKVLAGYRSESDSGATANILASLLFWMQEHTTRVLTIMTTNDINRLPPELYRPGRTDRIITFAGLNAADALIFGETLLKTFGKSAEGITKETVEAALESLYQKSQIQPHAIVAQYVMDLVKVAMSETWTSEKPAARVRIQKAGKRG